MKLIVLQTLVLQLKEKEIAVCSGVGVSLFLFSPLITFRLLRLFILFVFFDVTKVFMSAVSEGIPHVCTQFLKHVPVMHKTAIFVTIHYR